MNAEEACKDFVKAERELYMYIGWCTEHPLARSWSPGECDQRSTEERRLRDAVAAALKMVRVAGRQIP